MPTFKLKTTYLFALLTLAVSPALATADSTSSDSSKPKDGQVEVSPQVQGGAEYNKPLPEGPTVKGDRAVVRNINGKRIALAPENAPIEVQRAIWAANEIQGLPYIYGGGHKSFKADGYDCSGTVSYALHGAGLLDSPLDSSSFMSYGEAGKGKWITIYTNPGHAFVIIAGLRLDTSGKGGKGPRWRTEKRGKRGFTKRHPANF